MSGDEIVVAYRAEVIALAESRGYDHAAHMAALESGDVDAVSLTHPFNWLTEEEVEDLQPFRVVDG